MAKASKVLTIVNKGIAIEGTYSKEYIPAGRICRVRAQSNFSDRHELILDIYGQSSPFSFSMVSEKALHSNYDKIINLLQFS